MTKRSKNKRIQNPLMRRRPRVPRPKMAFDGQVLDSTLYQAQSVSVLGFAKDQIHISGDATSGVARPVAAMVNLYNEYKFRSVTFEWVPSISPSSVDAGSRIHVAFVDNPEKILNYDALLPAIGTVNAVRSVRNCRTFNAWERFTYTVPLTYRRKLFDIDANPTVTIDTLDRSNQGEIQIAIETISPAVSLGTYRVSYKMELHGLAFTQLT